MHAKYLMITSWDDHWDKIGYRYTYYPKSMMKEGMNEDLIEDNARTIFIKINKETKEPEKAWIGTVSNFIIEGDKVRFKVNIEKETPVPEEYRGKSEGWYFIGNKKNFTKRKISFRRVNNLSSVFLYLT